MDFGKSIFLFCWKLQLYYEWILMLLPAIQIKTAGPAFMKNLSAKSFHLKLKKRS